MIRVNRKERMMNVIKFLSSSAHLLLQVDYDQSVLVSECKNAFYFFLTEMLSSQSRQCLTAG